MSDPAPHPTTTPSSSEPANPNEEQQQREALAAFTATLHSVGNNLEAPLRDRASTIKSNAVALEKQEAELAENTARLARQNAQWTGLADETREGLKEIGDVQNWAEMIERDLLVMEEMMDGVEAKERETPQEGELEENGNGNGNVNGKQHDGKKGGWLRWW